MTPVCALCVFMHRQEFGPALSQELADLQQGVSPAGMEAGATPADLSVFHVPDMAAIPTPLVFERQRIENALALEWAGYREAARNIVKRVMPAVPVDRDAWTCHAFNVGSSVANSRMIETRFIELCRERFPALARRFVPWKEAACRPGTRVVSICAHPGGLWTGVGPLDRLPDRCPGGEHRMPFDRNAPSRSYLKIEEALDVMGEQPAKGQTVVDLGAAPGGWSYAFLKRGCLVTAVDNGPMKISGPGAHGGTLTHVRKDGVVYLPPPELVPVDWLVSDMLTVAGTNIGMLRKWFDGRLMARFIVNIKLPQDRPYDVIKPIRQFLGGIPRVSWRLRHLYHDRREVTLFGWLL